MDLKTFVSESLVQICEGIKDAQGKVGDLGACISPRLVADTKTNTKAANPHERATHPSLITFDVAVEAVHENVAGETIDTGGKLQVVALTGGHSREKHEESHSKMSSVSRIKFDLYVIWPSSTYTDGDYKGPPTFNLPNYYVPIR